VIDREQLEIRRVFKRLKHGTVEVAAQVNDSNLAVLELNLQLPSAFVASGRNVMHLEPLIFV
jgi:hypothetical protein